MLVKGVTGVCKLWQDTAEYMMTPQMLHETVYTLQYNDAIIMKFPNLSTSLYFIYVQNVFMRVYNGQIGSIIVQFTQYNPV